MRIPTPLHALRAFSTLLLPALLILGCAREAAAPRPDIVVYLVDTLRADHLEIYGYERPTSPALTAFAERAIVYENAYSPSSWTKPSVASLLTGMYPSSHLALEKRDLLPESVVTAAEYFRENGYETAAIVSSPWIIPTFRFDQGFDHFEIVELNGSVRGTRASHVHAAVARFLASRAEEDRAPLFLYVHTRDPHAPYAPAPEHLRAVDPDYDGAMSSVAQGSDSEVDIASVRTLYDGEIRANDAAFGALMTELEAAGIDDNAAIVFTSDHGEEFMEHGTIGHGKVVWNVAVHIPLVIKLPGDRFAGTRIGRAASLVDVLPALGEIAGLPPREEWEGRSVLPASAREGERERSIFVDESRDAVERFAVIEHPWKGIYETRPEQS
ncbi:MAG: sulfatase, partial [Gemmatimonadetes bacterium]|nr:sulfatase [Gemmatimonadota bacterium]